jgi:hypothetical protein
MDGSSGARTFPADHRRGTSQTGLTHAGDTAVSVSASCADTVRAATAGGGTQKHNSEKGIPRCDLDAHALQRHWPASLPRRPLPSPRQRWLRLSLRRCSRQRPLWRRPRRSTGTAVMVAGTGITMAGTAGVTGTAAGDGSPGAGDAEKRGTTTPLAPRSLTCRLGANGVLTVAR